MDNISCGSLIDTFLGPPDQTDFLCFDNLSSISPGNGPICPGKCQEVQEMCFLIEIALLFFTRWKDFNQRLNQCLSGRPYVCLSIIFCFQFIVGWHNILDDNSYSKLRRVCITNKMPLLPTCQKIRRVIYVENIRFRRCRS